VVYKIIVEAVGDIERLVNLYSNSLLNISNVCDHFS